MSNTLWLRFSWPVAVPAKMAENFFLGLWHPSRAISVDWERAPEGIQPVSTSGRNWLFLSNTSPLHDYRTGLVHGSGDGRIAVAFRGYLVNPAIHSYSPSEKVTDYWIESNSTRHNGVFSAAVVQDNGRTLNLLTDAFGFGPLYYRTWNGAILFSTNPRFLAVNGDTPDYIGWRTLMQSGFIPSDRTLSLQVSRVPAGVAISCSSAGIKKTTWFDFDNLPNGKKPVDIQSLHDVEDCFQIAMSRCLQLRNGKVNLPLSSGHDSRRILATLLDRQIDFNAFTVRIRQKEYRDLDATVAAAMAKDFGFSHSIIELGEAASYPINDVTRRILTDSETSNHSWAVSLMESLPSEPSIVFDGILGDILGNPGFRMPGLYKSQEEDLALIIQECITDSHDFILSNHIWPSAQTIKEEIIGNLKPFLHKPNMAEFAFILLRQRRATSLWSQQLLPAGHVPVCPYLDLDYISLLLEFIPAEKHQTIFQRSCLQEFWPEFFKYPGNRDIPADMPSNQPDVELERCLQCCHRLCTEIDEFEALPFLKNLLASKGKIALMLAKRNRVIAVRCAWFLHPIMELVSRQFSRKTCWDEIA